MTTKTMLPRPGEEVDPAMSDELRAAYEAHTLAQILYGRMTVQATGYPTPYAAPPVWPAYWPSPYGGGWG